MPRNIIFIIIILIIAGALGFGVYYFLFADNIFKNSHTGQISGNKTTNNQGEKVLTPEEAQAQLRKDFSETITGVINFRDKGNVLKTTITSDDGKEYTLWPPQRQSVYETFGVKNGDKVEIWAKPSSSGKDNIEWAIIKPI